MSEKLFSQRGASAYLTANGVRVHESELSKMGSYGVGPRYQRIGQQKIFTQSDLDDWLFSQLHGGDESSSSASRA